MVKDSSFYLSAQGGRLPGRVVGTESSATITPLSRLPWETQITIVVDGNRIFGADRPLLDADGDGLPGGVRAATLNTEPRETIPPMITVTSPISTGVVQLGDRLQGTLDGTGSEAASMNYRFDDLPELARQGCQPKLLPRETGRMLGCSSTSQCRALRELPSMSTAPPFARWEVARWMFRMTTPVKPFSIPSLRLVSLRFRERR